MGMYSYTRLAIWSEQEQRPIKGETRQKIIQALYDDQEANPKGFAQNTFDLNGNRIDSTPWYHVEQNISLFSTKYPEYSFVLGQKEANEDEDYEDGNDEYFQIYHNGKQYDGGDGIYDMFDYPQLFKPSFILSNTIEDLKSKVAVVETQDYLKLYIPTNDQEEASRIHRVLELQSNIFEVDITPREISHHAQHPNGQTAVEIKYSLFEKNPQEVLVCFWKIAEQYLIQQID